MARKGISLAEEKSAAEAAANDNDGNNEVPATVGEEAMDPQDEPDDDLPMTAQSIYFRNARGKAFHRVSHEIFIGWAAQLDTHKKKARTRARRLLRDRFAGKASARLAAFAARFGEPGCPEEIDEWLASKISSSELAGLFGFFSMAEAVAIFHQMCHANLALVVSVAKRSPPYRRGLAPLDELIQMGNIGLMKGVAAFDHRKGFTFATYATWWIKHEVMRGFNDTCRTIRIPVHVVDAYHKLIGLAQKNGLDLDGDRTAAIEKLAAITGWKEERVKKVLDEVEDVRDAPSLDSTLPGTDWSLLNVVPDQTVARPDDLFEKAEFVSAWASRAKALMAEKHPKEWLVLCHRYGLEGQSPKTLEEIGTIMELTRERIRQIEAKALRRLRDLLARRKISNT